MTSSLRDCRAPLRRQRTLTREVVVSGVGLFGGANVSLRFLPAAENSGITFQRIDLRGSPPIPALIDYVIPRPRRTAIGRDGVAIETIEHVMAALAGLQIDNCLVQLNAPEPPIGDGSAQIFVDALLDAGIEEQGAARQRLVISNKVQVFSLDHSTEMSASSSTDSTFTVSYDLNYGHTQIGVQSVTIPVTPQNFIDAIAFARTFVLEEEVSELRKQGYGLKATPENVLVFGPSGVIGNSLHTPDECARHKILDVVGDLALIGCDIVGRIRAHRSGHLHTHELVRDLLVAHSQLKSPAETAA